MKEMFKGEHFPMELSELDSTQLEKIESHAARFGHQTEDVIAAVLTNSVAYRAIVGKNPGRMDYYENALVSFLNQLECVSIASKLPKSGPGAHHLYKGRIEVGARKAHHKKSLDIYVQFQNGENLHIIHKYTKEEGGAQDNQFREAKDALSELELPDGTTRLHVAAILDGDYYSKVRRTGTTRLQDASSEFSNAIVCTYQNFLEKTEFIWRK